MGVGEKVLRCMQEGKEGSDAGQRRMRESPSDFHRNPCRRGRMNTAGLMGRLLERRAAKWPLIGGESETVVWKEWGPCNWFSPSPRMGVQFHLHLERALEWVEREIRPSHGPKFTSSAVEQFLHFFIHSLPVCALSLGGGTLKYKSWHLDSIPSSSVNYLGGCCLGLSLLILKMRCYHSYHHGVNTHTPPNSPQRTLQRPQAPWGRGHVYSWSPSHRPHLESVSIIVNAQWMCVNELNSSPPQSMKQLKAELSWLQQRGTSYFSCPLHPGVPGGERQDCREPPVNTTGLDIEASPLQIIALWSSRSTRWSVEINLVWPPFTWLEDHFSHFTLYFKVLVFKPSCWYHSPPPSQKMKAFFQTGLLWVTSWKWISCVPNVPLTRGTSCIYLFLRIVLGGWRFH